MIDNHNSLWKHPLSMEEMWMTACWHNHVFWLLLAVTVVNIQNGGAYSAEKSKALNKVTKCNTMMEQLYLLRSLLALSVELWKGIVG